MNLAQIEVWLLDHFGKEVFTPGLRRMRDALGPELIQELNSRDIVTIAGTNGKGETTLRLSRLLKDRVHCTWVSPHVERISERFTSETGEIETSVLWRHILSSYELIQEKRIGLSYYEFLFLVFCSWAKERGAKTLLLEVGLGGRLDAVNVLDAKLVLIPSISRDHQEFLGNRYDLILREKLGVLRSGATLIHFLNLNYLKERSLKFASSLGAEVVDLGQMHERYALPFVPLHHFSRRNQLLAEAAANFLRGENLIHQNTFENTETLPHRGEVIHQRAKWYLYGSHNVDGMRKLIQFLTEETYNLGEDPFDVVVAAFSKRNPKDLRLMMKLLKRLPAKKLVVTSFEHPKAADGEWLKETLKEEGLDFVSNIFPMVQAAKGGRILVTGSYYFLGPFKSRLGL